MKLELADPGRRRKKVSVEGYKRKANFVPAYSRAWPMNDSSLFSIKLAELNGGGIINVSAFITVPDPNNIKAPRRVRVDMFNSLPDSEFLKVVSYAEQFNTQEDIDNAIQYRLCSCDPSLNDGEADSALGVVDSIFHAPVNGTTIVEDSFWNKEWIPGIKNKYSLPVAGIILYKFIF